MELRHLRTFLAVAEGLHFGAAAEGLFLSPATVTEHVQALERETGVALFERGRRLRLTGAGEVLVGHARETLAHADAAVAALREYSGGQTGQLRAGILSNGAGPLTPLIIRRYMAAHPRVRMSVLRLNFHDHVSALLEHRVDVAFVRPPPEDGRLDMVRLSAEPRVAVLPAGHRLAGAPAIPAVDLLDEPFVSLADDVPATFVDYLHLRGLRGDLGTWTVEAGCGDVTDVLAAVSAGRGVASAVESFRGYENWPGVAYVTLTGAEPACNVLLSRRGDPSPLVSSFVAAAEAAVAETAGGAGLPSPA